MSADQWAAKVDRAANDSQRIEKRKCIAPAFTVPRAKPLPDLADPDVCAAYLRIANREMRQSRRTMFRRKLRRIVLWATRRL